MRTKGGLICISPEGLSDVYQAEIAFPAMESSLSFVASRNATAASNGSFADSRSTAGSHVSKHRRVVMRSCGIS
jgi:hypothetical protein